MPLCEEGRPDDAEPPAAADHAVEAALDVDGGWRSERAEAFDGRDRVILPCVLAEMGPSCADATVYVMTTGGVLLCQMDIPALAAGGLPQVERTPASPPASSAFFAAALPGTVPALPFALVRELPSASFDSGGAPRDGFVSLSCPPS